MNRIKNIKIVSHISEYGNLVVIPLLDDKLPLLPFIKPEDTDILDQMITSLAIHCKHLNVRQTTPVINHQAFNCLFIGIDSTKLHDTETLRSLGGLTARSILDIKAASVTILLPENIDRECDFQALGEGLALGAWDAELYKTTPKDFDGCAVTIVSVQSHFQPAIDKGILIGNSVNYARELSAMPSNLATPSFMAKESQKLNKENGFSVKVIEQADFSKMGFGGMEAVSRGSAQEAKFILIEYTCGGPEMPRVGLLGKTITFDAGGLSLKSPSQMADMKMDKSGGAVVLAFMQLLASFKPAINFIAAIPAMENLPGGNAYRPGDILTMYNGKTVEIMDTDAEGRLVMADALAYLEEIYSPDCIIDLATLTGAVVVALGHTAAALVSNDSTLAKKIVTAAGQSGEKVWEMPLYDTFRDDIKSTLADMKNLGTPKRGGVLTASAFLQNFIEKTPWAHLDIAGTAWLPDNGPYWSKGPSGFGVRLLQQFTENLMNGD